MHKKSKKKAAGQKECISKSKKNAKGSQKKSKKKAEQQFKKSKKKAKKKHMHNQISHTTLFCAIFLHFLCDFFAFFCIFCAFCLRFFCVFSRKRTKNAKKSQIQSKKNAKAKTRTFLIAFVLLFDCIFFAFFVRFFCIFCAFFVHFFCIFCAFFALV